MIDYDNYLKKDIECYLNLACVCGILYDMPAENLI
jgi:hypothetical protein